MAQLTVRAIKKYYDKKGILAGYTIQDVVTGQTRTVYKDQLKQAILNGQCEVTNMTLTSDGRLIGRAAPVPKHRDTKPVTQKPVSQSQQAVQKPVVKPQPVVQKPVTQPQQVAQPQQTVQNTDKASGNKQVSEIYTNGKNVVAVLVKGGELDLGINFTQNVKNNIYSNVKLSDAGKFELGEGIKKKSFKSVKPKLISMLIDKWGIPSLSVENSNAKKEYIVKVDNNVQDLASSATLTSILSGLIIDAAYTDKVKVLNATHTSDEVSVTLRSLVGVNDVKKIAKDVKKDVQLQVKK